MTDELKNRVKNKVLKCLKIASEFCPGLEIPEIRYNIKGSSAGECILKIKSSKCILRFNSGFLKDYTENFINVTVPHEVAHYVTHISCGNKVLPHGPEWKTWMKLFGIKYPQVTHSYRIVRKDKLRPWLYKCKCREHFFTNQRHNFVRSGKNYYCCDCDGLCIFVN